MKPTKGPLRHRAKKMSASKRPWKYFRPQLKQPTALPLVSFVVRATNNLT